MAHLRFNVDDKVPHVPGEERNGSGVRGPVISFFITLDTTCAISFVDVIPSFSASSNTP